MILCMDKILHHFETTGTHGFAGESNLSVGLLNGSKWISQPPTCGNSYFTVRTQTPPPPGQVPYSSPVRFSAEVAEFAEFQGVEAPQWEAPRAGGPESNLALGKGAIRSILRWLRLGLVPTGWLAWLAFLLRGVVVVFFVVFFCREGRRNNTNSCV